jgi:hypothetical protein
MPISTLLEGQAFDPERCQAMGSAYEVILQELKLTDRSDAVSRMIAEKVIELGREGERGPDRLRELALESIENRAASVSGLIPYSLFGKSEGPKGSPGPFDRKTPASIRPRN